MTEPKFGELPPSMRAEILADVRDELLLRTAEQIGLPNVAAAVKAAHAKIANLREHILNRSDLEEELVYVPGWDCEILVRALTGAERAKFQKQLVAQTPGAQPGQNISVNWDRMWSDIVVLSARDPEDKTLLFAPTDRDALLAKAAKNLEVVASVARRLSGLDDNAMANSKSESEDD